jgi:hypothetical protein
MKTIEGYWNTIPKIKDIAFPQRGKMQVNLTDGRSIIVPLSAFPSIKKLSKPQREHWFIIGGGISFDKSDEVIHVEQILGNFVNYTHEKKS